MTAHSSSLATLWAIVRLLRWDKPSGRLILMIPALWGAVLAGQGSPPWSLVVVIILGSLATSGAGCVVNDLWDRDLDPLVERTRHRPLATRELSVKVAVILLLVGLLCAWLLVAFLNPVTIGLSVAAVPLILLYPAAKRVFPVPQLVLALAWGFAVLISWTAVSGQDAGQPLWQPATGFLWGATLLWTLGFDTIYALADRLDDERVGIQSSARFFGRLAPTAIGLFFLGTVLLLLCVGASLALHFSYFLALAVSSVGWIWQTWRLHDVTLSPQFYPLAFQMNVGQGFIVLAGMISGSMWA
ncbi:MAG: 4-hydroxybenzoate solanesyltransferase [Cyanobacteriota bacterium]|nr:4-hydroxybenzoate solanesyltransferase [Cyanobacteriota bacterium]